MAQNFNKKTSYVIGYEVILPNETLPKLAVLGDDFAIEDNYNIGWPMGYLPVYYYEQKDDNEAKEVKPEDITMDYDLFLVVNATHLTRNFSTLDEAEEKLYNIQAYGIAYCSDTKETYQTNALGIYEIERQPEMNKPIQGKFVKSLLTHNYF